MMTQGRHLAQFITARIRDPLDDPRMGWRIILAAQLWKSTRCGKPSEHAA
jgi:hypothetical protein